MVTVVFQCIEKRFNFRLTFWNSFQNQLVFKIEESVFEDKQTKICQFAKIFPRYNWKDKMKRIVC